KLIQRNCITLSDFTITEIEKIIKFSIFLKKKKQSNNEIQYLKNKNIVLIFEQPSTRTKCSAIVACNEQGAHVTYLDSINSHFKYKESIKDTIIFLSSLYDGILYRGKKHTDLENIVKNSSIPVWNGLTDKTHPTQILSDLVTIKEYSTDKKWSEINITYVGDATNNICSTFIEIAKIINLNLTIVSPKELKPNINTIDFKNHEKYKNIKYTENIEEGVQQADFIYTDIWLSMNESEKLWNDRINILKNYQVNQNMILLSNNKNVKIMHCLPALYDSSTKIGKKILLNNKLNNGVEITHDVFFSKNSIVFDQAKNKIFSLKAIMISSLIKLKYFF
ncbi:ornithine carbamoyltransferase, partial [Buchnera aphidicola (Thelaxes californica)]